MTQPIEIVALIIVLTGLIGGLAASMAQTPTGAEGEVPVKAPTQRFLLLGIIAAACVPLFLSLLKSQLIQSIFTTMSADGKTKLPPAYESYLVFVGLCLIAAFSARRFIDSVSAQVLQRLDEVDAKAAQAAAAANTAKEIAQEAAEEVESADNIIGGALPADLDRAASLDATDDDRSVSISPVERRVLEAMAKRTYRTRTGIAEDSGVSRNRISELLEALADKKLALPTTSPRTGGARWIITGRGQAALDKSS